MKNLETNTQDARETKISLLLVSRGMFLPYLVCEVCRSSSLISHFKNDGRCFNEYDTFSYRLYFAKNKLVCARRVLSNLVLYINLICRVFCITLKFVRNYSKIFCTNTVRYIDNAKRI